MNGNTSILSGQLGLRRLPNSRPRRRLLSLNVIGVHSEDDILLIVFKTPLKREIFTSVELVVGEPDEPERGGPNWANARLPE